MQQTWYKDHASCNRRKEKMLAHIVSDIHLEMNKTPITNVSDLFEKDNIADVIFLSGDIGNVCEDSYWAFLTSCSETYQTVFVILGNHEAYGTTLEKAVRTIRERSKDRNNIVFLNKDTYDLEELGIRIAGTTLWSHVVGEQRSDIGCFISDHRAIRDWSVEHNNVAHAGCLKWLEKEIDRARADGKKLVIMTHHAPLLKSCHAKHLGSPLSSAFETDLSALIIANPHIRLWIYGHTHFSDARKIGETLVLSNQRGYAGENSIGFDRALCVDLSNL